MCGIAGAFVAPSDRTAMQLLVTRMIQTLAHRGPDGNGVYVDPELGFGFGHTRLSIVDLSAAGAQPIRSSNNGVLMVFNGEIYNHLELRKRLASDGFEPRWKGHSDSETLVELLSTWGAKRTLGFLRGMFAFASFDFRERTLTLARDIAGEKPLLYGQAGGKWGFASELSALEILLGDSLIVNKNSISYFMERSYLPGTQTIYQGIHKLPPGSFIQLGIADLQANAKVSPQLYWQSPQPERGTENKEVPSTVGNSDIGRLQTMLNHSIRSQLQADVPIGSFLSGGIDSSLVSAMATRIMPDLQTFSLGFADPSLDEAPCAKRVANFLGTKHHEIYVTDLELAETAKEIGTLFDEPFGDSSAIPSLILSRFARSQVTVALTGDGGDELFGGYPRHHRAIRLKNFMKVPIQIRTNLSRAVESVPSSWIQNFAFPLSVLDNNRFGGIKAGEKIKRLCRLLGATGELDLYRGLLSTGGSSLLSRSYVEEYSDSYYWTQGKNFVDSVLLFDFHTYLPGDILYKIDRASMAYGLETRAPLLGREIIEFAQFLSSASKIRRGVGKRQLRQLLELYVPKALWDRPKAGFSMPMANLLRNDLHDWASDQIYASQSIREELFDYKKVQHSWSRHLSMQEDRSTELWNFLTLSSWLSFRSSKSERRSCKS